jgi:hypothetical protein
VRPPHLGPGHLAPRVPLSAAPPDRRDPPLPWRG